VYIVRKKGKLILTLESKNVVAGSLYILPFAIGFWCLYFFPF
jgi:hypothetical protein